MAIKRTINNTDLREIKDHMENTARDLVKCYTLGQLSLMDGIDTNAIPNNGKYIPVRIDSGKSYYNFKSGLQRKPYIIARIRVDEIKYLYNKRNKRKKLTEEIKRE